MHSNFITPPDYVKSILVIDATEQQITALREFVESGDVSYNIYFYKNAMDQQSWFNHVAGKADIIIYADKNDPIEFLTK
jgi:hypothetical protein